MNDEVVHDIAIIGGGPTGLFASFYAGMRGMSTIIIDSLPELGGQLSALYPEKYVYDMPGFPQILAGKLGEQMAEQGTKFNPTLAMGERVVNLEKNQKDMFLLTTDKSKHIARSVLICAGPGAFSPKRLPIPSLEEFEGRGVNYFVRNKIQFTDKRILIIGGGDSALDWAMELEPIAKCITLIHRRDVFRAHEESVDWLFHKSRVTTKLWWELRCLEGGARVEKAIIFNNKTNEEDTLEVDFCLVNIGFAANLGSIKEWGLVMEGNQIVVNSKMETNIPGVYAAGDICTYDGKLRLIATGTGEACIAVCSAKTWVDPNSKFFPGHSSNMSL